MQERLRKANRLGGRHRVGRYKNVREKRQAELTGKYADPGGRQR